MKTLTIFSALMAFGLALFSCQEKSDATTNEDTSTNELRWDPKNTFVIDSAAARGYVSDYQVFTDSIIDALSHGDAAKEAYFKSRLVSGAKVYIHELQAMMDSVRVNLGEGESDDLASLYVMLAKDPLNDSDSTHIIFNLNIWNSGGSPANSQSMFFDFVRPCPTSCPSWFRQ